MSADNWTLCPRCNAHNQAKKQERVKRTEKAYGKVPPEQWLKLKQLSDAVVRGKDTLREDYEVGISSDGTFVVNYRGECDCGFSFTYNHEEKALKP